MLREMYGNMREAGFPRTYSLAYALRADGKKRLEIMKNEGHEKTGKIVYNLEEIIGVSLFLLRIVPEFYYRRARGSEEEFDQEIDSHKGHLAQKYPDVYNLLWYNPRNT